MIRAKETLKLSHGGQIVVLLDKYAFWVQNYNASLKLRLELSIVLSDAKSNVSNLLKKYSFIFCRFVTKGTASILAIYHALVYTYKYLL